MTRSSHNLAEHPPETRVTLPANWRDQVAVPGDAVIDDDGIARLPRWLVEASPVSGGLALTARWMVPNGGGFSLHSRLRRLAAGWTVDGLSCRVLRPPR